MSPEEVTTAQEAYQRVKIYEAKGKRRVWMYFGAAFWTFNTCLLVFIKPSFVDFLFLAVWVLFFCFLIYSTVSEKIVYRRDTQLLENLNGTFEPSTSFDSKDNRDEQNAETKRKIFTLRGLIGFGVTMGIVFSIEYFIHHVLPAIIMYSKK